ncbi:MAG: hypothetical protein PUP92_35925 [Rhizonema sp. PD38]|nr:hypothetical protein [Rhizonema sp. PD38]
MTFAKEQLQAVMTGTDLNRRIKTLQHLLGYAVKECEELKFLVLAFAA